MMTARERKIMRGLVIVYHSRVDWTPLIVQLHIKVQICLRMIRYDINGIIWYIFARLDSQKLIIPPVAVPNPVENLNSPETNSHVTLWKRALKFWNNWNYYNLAGL
jgi:hypothetical protein